jgi:hypothetical protein
MQQDSSIIQKFLEKYGLTIDQFTGKEKVGGDLYLGSVTSLPDGFNPTVGGDLITKNSLKRIGSTVTINVNVPKDFTWNVGTKKYALIDSIFCELLTTRQHPINGQPVIVHTAKKISKRDVFFIVQKDRYFAHSNSLKEAFADLEFKITSDKLKNSPIKKDTLITVAHYMAVTGACNFGCKNFMESNKIPFHMEGERVVEDSPIKAVELLKILKKTHAYGADRFEKLIVD